jgi:hypothetical protein
MAIIASVDYPNKRIYLHADTVGIDLDTLDVYKGVRALRVSNEDHRKFKPIIVAGGNIQKTDTAFTAPYIQLLYGCRIVPYDASQNLRVIRDTFTDDGYAGRDCFDRSGLSNEVNIDFEVDKVEVREVLTGGSEAPSVQQIRQEIDANSTELAAIKKKTNMIPGLY